MTSEERIRKYRLSMLLSLLAVIAALMASAMIPFIEDRTLQTFAKMIW